MSNSATELSAYLKGECSQCEEYSESLYSSNTGGWLCELCMDTRFAGYRMAVARELVEVLD